MSGNSSPRLPGGGARKDFDFSDTDGDPLDMLKRIGGDDAITAAGQDTAMSSAEPPVGASAPSRADPIGSASAVGGGGAGSNVSHPEPPNDARGRIGLPMVGSQALGESQNEGGPAISPAAPLSPSQKLVSEDAVAVQPERYANLTGVERPAGATGEPSTIVQPNVPPTKDNFGALPAVPPAAASHQPAVGRPGLLQGPQAGVDDDALRHLAAAKPLQPLQATAPTVAPTDPNSCLQAAGFDPAVPQHPVLAAMAAPMPGVDPAVPQQPVLAAMAAPMSGAQGALRGPGVSPETQSVLDSLKKTRETMWSVMPQMAASPPSILGGVPAYPPGQQLVAPAPRPMIAVPPPVPAGTPGGWMALTPVHPCPPAQHFVLPRPGSASAPSAPQTRSVHVQAETEPPSLPHWDSGLSHRDGGTLQDPSTLRRDFQSCLNSFRVQLLPEMRARREEVYSAVQGIDARAAELRRRCAEAERQGREEFEALSGHLRSVETLKLAVLNRERDVRVRLIDDIDKLARQVQHVDASGHSIDEMAAFMRDCAELRDAGEKLCSRGLSLPHVDVPIDDIPYEARARTENLKRFAVMRQLHQAKDFALWRMEQQRRQLLSEVRDAGFWFRQSEALLEKYGEALAFTCYFCAETFGANAANSRCPYNTGSSPRTGQSLAQDPRVPAHLWGAGVHFWVPQNVIRDPGVPQRLSAEEDDERLRDMMRHRDAPRYAASQSLLSPAVPSRPSTPPGRRLAPWYNEAPPGGSPQTNPFLPVPVSREHVGLSTGVGDIHLRFIAKACEQRGLDICTAFRRFDTNRDGLISQHEFRNALVDLGIGLSDDELTHLLMRLDANADGMVSYEEFLTQLFLAAHDPSVARVGPAFVEHFATHDASVASTRQRVAKTLHDRGVQLRQVFQLFDVDGDGVMSKSELAQVFHQLKLGIGESDVERLLRDIAASEDGRVNIQDFLTLLQM